MVVTQYVKLKSKGNCDVINITDDVQTKVNESGLWCGTGTIFCPSATSALTTLEYEPGCIKDLCEFLDRIIQPEANYHHNLRWGDGNGHSHLRSALLQPDLTIPIVDGRLSLGTWQQIIFIDFDNRSRQRKLVVQLMGELESSAN